MALSVTKRALVALRSVLDDHEAVGARVLRLTAGADRKLAFVLDMPRDDDLVIRLDHTAVMVVAPRLKSELDGLTLDLRDDSEGPEWTLRKAKSVKHGESHD